MNNLIFKGKVNLDDMEFYHIEGGFGSDKKSILVRDIAFIHGKEFKHINEAINNNRKRFSDGIDIIDLKSVDIVDRVFLRELGFSNSSISNSRNIYLLSERGYAKLLKILEDDFAWDQYEKLVDGYFNMRELAKSKQLSTEPIKESKLELHKEKLDKATITSNYLIDYVKSTNGYMPSHLLDSFATAIQAVNIDIVDSLKKMNKFNQAESHQ